MTSTTHNLVKIAQMIGIFSITALSSALITACSGSQLILERVVTATPDANIIVLTVTPPAVTANATTVDPTTVAETALAPAQASPVASEGAVGTPAASTTISAGIATAGTATPLPEATIIITATAGATIPATATLSAFPTETRAEIYIAQQDFENGYMFWIEPQRAIWVLLIDQNNPNKTSGEWRVYQDPFVEGTDAETDATLMPPDGRYQPRRGFGKLWRTTPGLRDALGWGVTPEFGLNTTYVYQPGGTLTPAGAYSVGPGKHFLTTLSKQVFALAEPGADGVRRWERVG